MHPRTRATLRRLEDRDWFANVGLRDSEAVIVLSCWDEAIAHCGSLEWENLCLEADNQLRERILERSKERFLMWNDVVDIVKADAVELVLRKTKAVVDRYKLPKVFVDTVRWDILGVCLEAEYADVFPPAFYASHAYWYTRGHFPCGWQGKFPNNGKLIVY